MTLIRALCLTLGLATPAMADSPMAAAGRIEASHGGTCSATLIAPDQIVTAAHCVIGFLLGGHRYLFRTGAYPGQPGTVHEVTGGALHPLYDLPGQGVRRFRFDMAVLTLEAPVEGVSPLPLGDPAVRDEALIIATWLAGDTQRARERSCNVLPGRAGVVTLDCMVQGGESGGAVLRQGPNGPELVAVLSSRGTQDNRPVAIAANVSAKIAPIQDRIR